MSYCQLLSYAVYQSRHLLAHVQDVLSPRGQYILSQANMLTKVEVQPLHRPNGVAADFIDLCISSFDRVENGEHGDVIVGEQPGLWYRLMHEWPMGEYAKLATDILLNHNFIGPNRTILEIGAGVGNASIRIRDQVGETYVRTDVRPELCAFVRAPGEIIAWDFDQELPQKLAARSYDVVFSVNALHCAQDPERTVKQIMRILDRRGVLLIGEGQPWTKPNHPWALNLAFGMLDGWWNHGGFKEPTTWLNLLGQIGTVNYQPLHDGGHHLGGIFWVQAD